MLTIHDIDQAYRGGEGYSWVWPVLLINNSSNRKNNIPVNVKKDHLESVETVCKCLHLCLCRSANIIFQNTFSACVCVRYLVCTCFVCMAFLNSWMQNESWSPPTPCLVYLPKYTWQLRTTGILNVKYNVHLSWHEQAFFGQNMSAIRILMWWPTTTDVIGHGSTSWIKHFP